MVVDKQDVTFGSGDKVASAIEELMAEASPTALFLVTTCVPEIIGEDYHAVAQEAEEKYKISVHIISTNHYSGKNGEYGFELVGKATHSLTTSDQQKFLRCKPRMTNFVIVSEL